MFTLDQIKQAHANVKSGADFPKYIQDLKKLGVVFYDNYVTDGRTDYYGLQNLKLSAAAKYPAMKVQDQSSQEKLEYALAIHQRGETDYLTFCKQAAGAGVEKWRVHILNMTCSYYNKAGTTMVVEEIPEE